MEGVRDTRGRNLGNGDAWDRAEDALEFATDSFEVAIVMMIDAEAIAFGIAEYDVGASGHNNLSDLIPIRNSPRR